MAHFQLMYPSQYLAACDLGGKDVKATIESVKLDEIVGTDGKREKKPIVTFRGAKKRFVLCKTNARQIAKHHGTDTDGWVGKEITLYPTTCQSFGETKECVRIR